MTFSDSCDFSLLKWWFCVQKVDFYVTKVDTLSLKVRFYRVKQGMKAQKWILGMFNFRKKFPDFPEKTRVLTIRGSIRFFDAQFPDFRGKYGKIGNFLCFGFWEGERMGIFLRVNFWESIFELVCGKTRLQTARKIKGLCRF